MSRSFLICLALLAPRAFAQECGLGPGAEAPLAAPVQALSEDLDRVFAGCRPSPGECVMSCPDRQAAWELDASLCDAGGREPFACYCLVDAEPELEDPPEGSFYVGCRPTAGECVNSCPTRNAWMQEDPGSCPEELGEGTLACYCR
jgi:hypothetical protein